MAKKNKPKKQLKKQWPRPKINLLIPIGILVFSLFFFIYEAGHFQDQRIRAAGSTDCTVTASQMSIKANEQTMFDAINNYREQYGRARLTWSTQLKQASAWMSKDMLTTRNVSHTDSLGRTPDTRLFDCGLPATNTYGENLENGANDPTQIMYGWKIDTPKNDTLLNPNYTVGAVTVETDASGEYAFWTFDAAGPNTSPLTPQASATPISGVPNPACLGGTCTTIVPSNSPSNAPSVGPSISVTISTGPQPSGTISGSPAPSGTPGAGGTPRTGGNQGLIGLLLAFLLLILKFFMSLFGR